MMAPGNRSLLIVALALPAAESCGHRPALVSTESQLALAATALREGQLEAASEIIVEARRRDPWHIAAARSSALMADLLWRDEDAIREQSAAIRLARRANDPDVVTELRGQLGEQLFQAGRWGESSSPLLAGAIGEVATRPSRLLRPRCRLCAASPVRW